MEMCHGAEVRLLETMEVSDLHEGWGLKNLPTWTPTTHEIHEGFFLSPPKRWVKKKSPLESFHVGSTRGQKGGGCLAMGLVAD